MTNAIRIRVEHYDVTSGMISSSQIIDDQEVVKPVDGVLSTNPRR